MSLRKETGFRPEGKRVVIIGAGGAARGILYSLLALRPASVALVNRPVRRADKLAVEFAVCDHWFCSLPGDTWPNRDFLHAGESFGHVDRHEAPIWSNPPTIFALLDKVPAPRPTWRVYTEGVAHVFLYSQLFTMPGRRGSHRQLLADIRGDRLPSYAFVEPDYGMPGAGNSQHPSQACSREEFVNGGRLIADIRVSRASSLAHP